MPPSPEPAGKYCHWLVAISVRLGDPEGVASFIIPGRYYHPDEYVLRGEPENLQAEGFEKIGLDANQHNWQGLTPVQVAIIAGRTDHLEKILQMPGVDPLLPSSLHVPTGYFLQHFPRPRQDADGQVSESELARVVQIKRKAEELVRQAHSPARSLARLLEKSALRKMSAMKRTGKLPEKHDYN